MSVPSPSTLNLCPDSCPCRVPVPPLSDPCSCGMYQRGSQCPFCEIVAGGVTATMPKSKQEDLEEWDRRTKQAESEARALVSGHDGRDTSPETPVVRKRKRRSAAEMKIVRAEAAARIALARARAEPDWLKDQDSHEAEWLADLNERCK